MVNNTIPNYIPNLAIISNRSSVTNIYMNSSNKNIIIQMSLDISSLTEQYFYNSVSRFACYFASFCGTWRFIVSFIHFNPLSFERIISYGSNTSFISQIYFLLQVWKRRKFKIQHLCGQFLVQHKKCWFTLENWVGGIFNTIFEKVHYISIQKSYCKLSFIPGISRIACLR